MLQLIHSSPSHTKNNSSNVKSFPLLLNIFPFVNVLVVKGICYKMGLKLLIAFLKSNYKTILKHMVLYNFIFLYI